MLKPSYRAYQTPIIAVINIKEIVLKAPICEPIFINKYISKIGIKIIDNKTVFICL